MCCCQGEPGGRGGPQRKRCCLRGWPCMCPGGDSYGRDKFPLALIVRNIQNAEILKCGGELFTNCGSWQQTKEADSG